MQVKPKDAAAQETPPPFLGTWRNVYTMVALELVALIGVFYFVTRWAS